MVQSGELMVGRRKQRAYPTSEESWTRWAHFGVMKSEMGLEMGED